MDPIVLAGVGAMFVMMLVMLTMIAGCFQKCGPNEAMIVSGMGTARNGLPYTIVKGGGCIVLPIIQQRCFISLEMTSIDLKGTPSGVSHDDVTVSAAGSLHIKVGSDDASIARAAEALLNKPQSDVAEIVKQIVGAALQQSLTGMALKENGNDTSALRDKVKNLATEKLKELGLIASSFTLILQPSEYSTSLSGHQ